AAIGFLLALGPEFMVGNEAIAPTPLYPFYEQIPIFKFHRIAVRAYALVVIAAAILSAVALQHLLFARRNKKLALALIAGVFAFHVLEDVPLPMRAYKVGPWVEIPPEYRECTAALRKQSDENVLLLDLPTRFGFRFETMPLEEYQSP